MPLEPNFKKERRQSSHEILEFNYPGTFTNQMEEDEKFLIEENVITPLFRSESIHIMIVGMKNSGMHSLVNSCFEDTFAFRNICELLIFKQKFLNVFSKPTKFRFNS